MNSWWIDFGGARAAACVDAEGQEKALELAEQLGGAKPVSAERLPYPAAPRLNSGVWPGGHRIPAFCWKPEQCKGRSSCPQRLSCTE